MPASGKSTAGVLIAKKTGYGFIDTDLLIQKREGALLCDILKKHGAEGFIEIEERVNAQLDAMKNLKSLGTVVYLKVGLKELERRLGGKDIFKRGVVMKKKGETLAELLSERTPLYEEYADKTVICDGLSLEGTVAAVIDAVNK